MEHFNIVYALCRSAMASPNSAIVQQVNRLKKALKNDGLTKEVKCLEELIDSSSKNLKMTPCEIKKSASVIMGEELSSTFSIPVDKETSTPLAEVLFDNELPTEMPEFEEHVKNAIFSIIEEWSHYDMLAELDVIPPTSCLIYGLPGTGKTHLAKWIAKQVGVPVVLARLEGLMSSFLGTTSKNIGNLFTFANRYKCILLLDEFDALAKLRDDPQEVGEVKRVVNTLLQCLDSRKNKGLTIGITNHEMLLDPAIWRRFDVQMEIPKPSPNVLISLLKKFIRPLKISDNEIKLLAWCINDATGADAQMLADWIKRSSVVNKDMTPANVIRQFVLLNSRRVSQEKQKVILNSDEEFVNALIGNNLYSFKQVDIAMFFGMTASSLSKLKSKIK